MRDEALPSCGHAYPSAGGGCDTDELIAAFGQRTGLPMASFAGCYPSSGFTLGR